MALRMRRAFLLGLFFIWMSIAGVAQAAVGETITMTPNCSGFTTRGGFLTTNRDNTGRSREAIVITATDGSGQTLYENTSIYPLNQRIPFEDGTRINWTAQPQYNPIVLRIVSLAGNNEPEQLVYLVTGTCAGLPTYGSGVFVIGDDLTVYPLVARMTSSGNGITRDPNQPPPRPTNPTGTAEAQPGYAIVNTDNLFLRSGDGPEYTPVGILDGGTRLVVVGSNGRLNDEDALWWYVEVGGLRGWVKNEFLILRGDLRGLPVIPVEGEMIQPTLYVGLNTPLYSSRAVGGGLLCEISGGRLYNVLAADAAEPNWYLIEATCNNTPVNGWIQAARGLLRNPAGTSLNIIR